MDPDLKHTFDGKVSTNQVCKNKKDILTSSDKVR